MFPHNFGKREGSLSWTEDAIIEPRNYDKHHEKKMGVVALSESDIVKLPPVDTVLSDIAVDKLQRLAEDTSEHPFFFAIGFR